MANPRHFSPSVPTGYGIFARAVSDEIKYDEYVTQRGMVRMADRSGLTLGVWALCMRTYDDTGARVYGDSEASDICIRAQQAANL